MFKTFLEALHNSFHLYSDKVAFRWRNEKNIFQEMTFREVDEATQKLALALLDLGVKFQQHIGLIADVSHTWTLSNLAIQRVGAVDVPRGTDSTNKELAYILEHSDSNIVFIKNESEFEKIESGLKDLKSKHKVTQYIVMDNKLSKNPNKKLITLEKLIEKGSSLLEKKNNKELKELEKRSEKLTSESLSTIIYTSGTTGEPKGVMTTHGNFAFQISVMPKLLEVTPNDSGLTLLPPWHVFGRIAEYLFISLGVSITYTDVKNIGDDLKTIRPTFVPAVPRIWEGVYNKVITNVKKSGKENIFNFFKNFALKFEKHKRVIKNREILYKPRNIIVTILLKTYSIVMISLLFPLKKLGQILVFNKVLAATGGKLKASISGGGALPSYIDDFFSAIGVKIIEGYGMTETSPIISCRRMDNLVPGTVGPVIEQTEYRLIDLEGNDVTSILGAKGTLHIRGPQVMQGYYKNPKKTKEVLSEDGWMNTGDLVRINTNGEISIVGRSKDTIVLVGGENIEPTPIEEKLKESSFIDHVMCIGQDKKSIGALIVPNQDEIKQYAKAKAIEENILIENPEILKLFKKEISKLISSENGFKGFEKISNFRLLAKPFEQGDELNNTLKVKRHVVSEKYEDLIEEIYN